MIRQKLKSRSVALGSWITIGSTTCAEIMCRAGFDWLVVDLEHSAISISVAADIIRVIDLCGVTPMVRLTSNDPNQIKRVMDAGAHGIVVPNVNTAEEARLAVAATRYAPNGVRGVGLARAQGYGFGFKKYLEWQVNGPIVVVMIEHKNALLNLEEILSTPGVDAFFIGPYDLSCSIGIPGEFTHPDFIQAIETILKAGNTLNCPSGIHIVEPDLSELENSIKAGYNFIAYSVDSRVLDVGMRAGVQKKNLIMI